MKWPAFFGSALGCLALSSPALPCSLPGPGFWGVQAEVVRAPRNAVLFIEGSAVWPVTARVMQGGVETPLSVQLFATQSFGSQLIRIEIPDEVATGDGDLLVNPAQSEGQEVYSRPIQIGQERDDAPPAAPVDITVENHASSQELVPRDCFGGGLGSEVTFSFPAVSDDFAVSHYSLVASDTREVLNWLRPTAGQQTISFHRSEPEGLLSRCYEIIAHDFADNRAASEELCIELEQPGGCACVAHVPSGGWPAAVVFGGLVAVALKRRRRRE